MDESNWAYREQQLREDADKSYQQWMSWHQHPTGDLPVMDTHSFGMMLWRAAWVRGCQAMIDYNIKAPNRRLQEENARLRKALIAVCNIASTAHQENTEA